MIHGMKFSIFLLIDLKIIDFFVLEMLNNSKVLLAIPNYLPSKNSALFGKIECLREK